LAVQVPLGWFSTPILLEAHDDFGPQTENHLDWLVVRAVSGYLGVP